ncbi:hypothetical protein M3Y97_00603000 [Aphelenchoides bicaudatus]|nr:hypothetical protein M3Y97_00603000 [Aphelenchoides bicaudatus]
MGLIEKMQEIKQAHLGWIWSLEEQSNGVLLSLGFDHFLKEWHLLNGEIKLADELCLGSPVLWSRSTGEMVLVGTCNSKITVFDQRDWSIKVRTLTYPRQPVIDAVVPKDSPTFYTMSEEGVSCVDNRMWSKFKEFKWNTTCHSISKCHDLLYVSRSVNDRQDTQIHLIDTKTLSILNEINICGASKTRLSATDSTVACLSNKLAVYTGGVNPNSIWQFDGDLSNYINLDYTNGRLALTSTTGKLACFY